MEGGREGEIAGEGKQKGQDSNRKRCDRNKCRYQIDGKTQLY